MDHVGLAGLTLPQSSNDLASLAQGETRNGTLARTLTKLLVLNGPAERVKNEGPKHKEVSSIEWNSMDFETRKKLKIEKETKRLSLVLATHLGLAEVTLQPQ